MLTTPVLHRLVRLAEANGWRLASSVITGSCKASEVCAELCANGRVDELERLHRFTHDWEAAGSLLLRSGDPHAFDAYEAHDRNPPAPSRNTSKVWPRYGSNNTTMATPSRWGVNQLHVDIINQTVRAARLADGQAERSRGGRHRRRRGRLVGDVVATAATTVAAHLDRGRSEPRHLDRHRHRRRWVPDRVPPGRTRRRHPPPGLRHRARPVGVRRHRARLSVRHRDHRHGPGLHRHDSRRPVRRCRRGATATKSA